MLRKLAEKLNIPYEKMPMNVVEEFGNSSGACIPVCATYNLAEELRAVDAEGSGGEDLLPVRLWVWAHVGGHGHEAGRTGFL